MVVMILIYIVQQVRRHELILPKLYSLVIPILCVLPIVYTFTDPTIFQTRRSMIAFEIITVLIIILALAGYCFYLIQDFKQRQLGVGIYMLVIIPCLLILMSLLNLTGVSNGQMGLFVLYTALAVSVLALLVYFLYFNKKLVEVKNKVMAVIGVIMISSVLSFISINAINYAFDTSESVTYRLEIIEMQRTDSAYNLRVIFRDNEVNVDVSREYFENTEVGNFIYINVYQGFLGLEYLHHRDS
jgi:predicted membrane channel-forming protein YqfA (hemolysin III family)